MITRLIRRLILALVRLYYPRIEVEGAENLPTAGPVIFVLNHPNGLLDPLLLMIATKQPVSFLAKDTFFRNPLGRLLMRMFTALPVYRQRDASGDDTRTKNEQTFARCRTLLDQGRALALFPEGTTHSEPRLLPLRSGAARIALSAEAQQGWRGTIQVVPVGLWYEDKQLFRSSVLLIVGKPFTLEQQHATYTTNPEQAVAQTTATIAASLGTVMFQAHNAELVRGLPLVVEWTVEHLQHARQQPTPNQMLAACTRLAHNNPQQLATLADQARRYARILRMLGIADPWSAELPLARRVKFWMFSLWLILGWPLAALGWLLSYGPYRLGGLIAGRLTSEVQVLGTMKLIAGAILVPIGWLIAAGWMAWLFDWRWAVGTIALAPLLAYSALRWSEIWREVRESIAATWLRVFERKLTDQLLQRRQALAQAVVRTVLQLND